MSDDPRQVNLLREEFERRRMRNASYSIRSYARDLGVSPASLSQVLSGKRELGLRNAHKIATSLGLSPLEARSFIGGALNRGRALSTSLTQLSDDAFRHIADWHHFAILSLGECKDNYSDPKHIAKRLGLSVSRAKSAFQRLLRLGLVKESRSRFQQTGESLTTTEDVPSEAIRSHHRQQLEKAHEALINVPIDERSFGSLTMAIDPRDLPKAKELLVRFRSEFQAAMQPQRKPDRVYSLNINFFPLSD